jgi:hypothetical protein
VPFAPISPIELTISAGVSHTAERFAISGSKPSFSLLIAKVDGDWIAGGPVSLNQLPAALGLFKLVCRAANARSNYDF